MEIVHKNGMSVADFAHKGEILVDMLDELSATRLSGAPLWHLSVPVE